jgi:predicted small lipoprotein YifL
MSLKHGVALAALAGLVACGDKAPHAPTTDAARAAAAAAGPSAAKEKEALQADVEAVVHGLPLLIMDLTAGAKFTEAVALSVEPMPAAAKAATKK